MMRKTFVAMAGIAALTMAMPASAATFLFPLLGNSSTSGTAGNARTFTATLGTKSVSAKITGWSIATTGNCAAGASGFNTASCVTKSYLGDYSHGLGVTGSGDQNGANNYHTIDNIGQQDFIIIQFDRKVKLISATFSPFSVDGSLDTDATIGVHKLNGVGAQPDLLPWNQNISLTTRNQFNNLFGTQYESSSFATSANTRPLDANGYIGRIWMIAASLQTGQNIYHDKKKDGFKLSNVTVENVGPVPEPGSWLMMIAGFGFVGAIVRRNRKLTVTTA
jgi:hypothetical protein